MFIVKKRDEKKGTIFPDEKILKDYENRDFGALISHMGIECLIGNDMFELGDSGVSIQVINTGEKGNWGLEQFKKYAFDMSKIIEDAMPLMSKKYYQFYQYFVSDFKDNGLVMPRPFENKKGINHMEENAFKAIGTVEEFKALKEKNKPKKPINPDEDYGTFRCPSCRGLIYTENRFETHKHCLLCGQAFYWHKQKKGLN